jgi:hypothetical protein
VHAKISRVRLAAAHEGTAELIVSVEYVGGGISEVPLDRYASEALLAHCNASDPDELIGRSWSAVRDALTTSYNRYQ